MKKVVVYGSRTMPCKKTASDEESLGRGYTCLNYIFNHLHQECGLDNFAVVSGMANGADSLAADYAFMTGYQLLKFPADWKKLGQQAGFIRNIEMASLDGLVAGVEFWDGISTGTQHMRHQLDSRGIHVIEVRFDSETAAAGGAYGGAPYAQRYKLKSLTINKATLPQSIS